jgi:glycosyltransferase involved in cell wall biosynthesis
MGGGRRHKRLMMKILHILATPRAEGTPNLVLDWLATGEHEQAVFVLHSQPADLTARLRSAAGWYGESDFFSMGRRKFSAIARGVHRVCREQRPDVVICWPTGFSNWACLGAKLAGVRHLLVHAGNPPRRGFAGDWVTRYGLWPLALMKATVLCCSDYVRDAYRSVPMIPGGLLQTVWNCTRAAEVRERSLRRRAERSPEPGSCHAIMVATLESHKDHETLLRAVPAIRAVAPGFRLRLAGDGSLRGTLEELAGNLGLSGIVEFLGTRKDVPDLLGESDLFVFSTTPREGLGSVLFEAMAAELPILASDVPACREILRGGVHGTLVPPSDPAAWSEAIVQSIRSPRDRHRLDESRDFALSFTARRMMDLYLGHVRTATAA